MRNFLLFFLIFELAHCTSPQCPSGLDLVRNGECIGNYTRINTYSDEAIKVAIGKCQEIHAYPISIHDAEDQSYWSGRIASNEFTVIGLVCNTTSKLWEWADGSALNYKPPSYDKPLNKDCTALYSGVSWMMHSDGWWTFYSQNHYSWSTDVFCTTQLSQPFLNPDGCYGFNDDNDDGECYQIGGTAESWQDAQLTCKQLGANLASIHNVNENSFVRRLATSNGVVHDIYLGATVSGKGGDYGWVDGSEWNYSNFYPGFPKSGFGDCIIMDTSTTSGQWMNMDCTAEIPIACVRDPKHNTGRNATCSTETYSEGVIITSPGFPFDASMPCEYYLKADTGKRVEVEIAFLEANSCCDFLTIYDGYAGGYVLANLTGEVSNVRYTTTSSNIMKVAWQPNGGVNVRGMAMTFRGV